LQLCVALSPSRRGCFFLLPLPFTALLLILEGCSGTEGKRVITSINDNEFQSTNPATSTGTKADSVWRRVK
jgi:hypothetical protein